MHNLRIQNELQRAVTDLRASGFWDFFLIYFFKYSVKEQGRIGNHAWITKQKRSALCMLTRTVAAVLMSLGEYYIPLTEWYLLN